MKLVKQLGNATETLSEASSNATRVSGAANETGTSRPKCNRELKRCSK